MVAGLDDYFALIETFWRHYVKELRTLSSADLERRGVAHWGACLLARINGTSPVDYLPEPDKRELARRLGMMILLDGVSSVERVLARYDGALPG